MKIHTLLIPLNTFGDQVLRLQHLQQVFADICNVLAPVVRDTKCWNRVALHHMMYKPLREQFPRVGSQMVCNAIYSVSRSSRMVYQSSQSPFNLQRLGNKGLPLLKFLPSAPVYFDRHTLSIKKGSLSMYTLDGRMRFQLNLSDEDFHRFQTWKLHEVILSAMGEQFTLNFSFVDTLPAETPQGLSEDHTSNALPEYILVLEEESRKLNSGSASSADFTKKAAQPNPPLHTTMVVGSNLSQEPQRLELRLPLMALHPVLIPDARFHPGSTSLKLQLNVLPNEKGSTQSQGNASALSEPFTPENQNLKMTPKMTGANS